MANDEEYEEVPPYEEWTISELKAELVRRKLNHAGNKPALIARLDLSDEIGTEIEADPVSSEDDPQPSERDWVSGNVCYVEFLEDLDGVPPALLPSNVGHIRMLAEAYERAVKNSDRKLSGGLYDGSLDSKVIVGDKVKYTYAIPLKKK